LDTGDPDFPTPEHIKEAVIKALEENHTHYGPAYGDQELREAVCLRLKLDRGIDRKPENVLITSGGSEAVYLIAATYINPGDEVLIFDPDYSAYAESVALFGGTPINVPRLDDFHIDLKSMESRITEKTKMVFFSNPGNPTGAVLSQSEICEMAKLAKEHNFMIVVDEVYDHLIYQEKPFFSICQVHEAEECTILLNSFSKTYAMTGWRVGYVVADRNIVNQIVKLHKSLMICTSRPLQKACIAALTGPQDCVNDMRAVYNARRLKVADILSDIENIQANSCEGAFYFFPRFNHSLTSKELTAYLAEKKLMVRSGTEFGDNGQKHFRITFATSESIIEEGLSRLKNALHQL
jgi:aspartate/methionine/tyrosine aminotransferase